MSAVSSVGDVLVGLLVTDVSSDVADLEADGVTSADVVGCD